MLSKTKHKKHLLSQLFLFYTGNIFRISIATNHRLEIIYILKLNLNIAPTLLVHLRTLSLSLHPYPQEEEEAKKKEVILGVK
jgi:hypothetical protein